MAQRLNSLCSRLAKELRMDRLMQVPKNKSNFTFYTSVEKVISLYICIVYTLIRPGVISY